MGDNCTLLNLEEEDLPREENIVRRIPVAQRRIKSPVTLTRISTGWVLWVCSNHS